MSKKRSSLSRHVRMLIHTGNFAVPPGTVAQITEHSRRNFRADRFSITDHPKEWVVRELRIGERRLWKGFAPGRDFAVAAVARRWTPFVDEGVKRGQAIMLLISYVGRLKRGRPFHGRIDGRAS